MKLSEVLKKAAIRGGIQMNDEALTAFLSSIEGTDVEVPDTIVSGINSLMNEEDAKANLKIKTHFKREALDPLDRHIAEVAEELGLSAEVVDALKKENNTYNKPTLLKNAIAEHLKTVGKKTDSPEAKKQIDELTAALQKTKEEGDAMVQKLQSEFENERVNNAIMAQFGNYTWSDAYDPADRPILAKHSLEQKLAAVGAKIKRNPQVPGGIELVNANDETLPFRMGNESVTFNQFTDQLMAEKNYIKTAAVNPPATSQTTAVPQGQATQSNYLTRLAEQNAQLLQSAQQ